MANSQSTYKNSKNEDLSLFLDIDLKTEKIVDFYYKGNVNLILAYKTELLELQNYCMDKPYRAILSLKRKKEAPISSLPLMLFYKAISDYEGEYHLQVDSSDILCRCYGLSESELSKQIEKNSDYDLKDIIAQTFATSACGSCLIIIKTKIMAIRDRLGVVPGFNATPSRVDKEGKWIKVKGMYPGKLLPELDQLKKVWMQREKITDQYEMEIKNIEGYHLWISVFSLQENKDEHHFEKLLEALSEYLKSEIGARFFLHLFS